VINATDLNVNDEEWDVQKATENLLHEVRFSLSNVPSLSRLAEAWERSGRPIRSISDLIYCYYSSFTVVRVPVEGRYGLLKEQIDKLRLHIKRGCKASFQAKRDDRMLSNSDELGIFLQSAFTHFAQTLDTPFNFIDASLRNNPIPKDFGGNILQLAIGMLQATRDSEWIFDRLSFVVASSVHLDCVRHDRKGKCKKSSR
jgi:hypothetical protein